MGPHTPMFKSHQAHFWIPLVAFVFSFLYPLFKWGLPWRVAFFIGVFGWTIEILAHRAFIGSY